MAHCAAQMRLGMRVGASAIAFGTVSNQGFGKAPGRSVDETVNGKTKCAEYGMPNVERNAAILHR
jgi:hypothetical protein